MYRMSRHPRPRKRALISLPSLSFPFLAFFPFPLTTAGSLARPDTPSTMTSSEQTADCQAVASTPLLIDRIGDRPPLIDRISPPTVSFSFPTISEVPVIRDCPEQPSFLDRISLAPSHILEIPPPPQLPPVPESDGRGSSSEGEGVRERTSFAWSASQWREQDAKKRLTLKGVRRNLEGELDMGDLYTYCFLMRALYGQNTRRHTPRAVRKTSSGSWSLVESAFLRATVELVLDPELTITVDESEPTNGRVPVPMLTSAEQEFDPQTAAELLAQEGATNRWFGHRWTIGYALSYLSEWGRRHYPIRSNGRIAELYCQVLNPLEDEKESPFSHQRTTPIEEDEAIIYLPFIDDLLCLVPTSRDHLGINHPVS